MITDEAGQRLASVLNTTGTLFRSAGREQIPTVRYRDSEDEQGRSVLEAVADYSVSANELIGRELRPVDLHTCGSTIELVDLTEGEVISGEVADLPNPKLMRATHARMITDAGWMEGFARHMLDMLARQSHALDHRRT